MQNSADPLLDRIRRYVREADNRLEVIDQKVRREDDWLYVEVAPVTPGLDARDYVETLADVEQRLNEEGVVNLFILPVQE